MTDKNIEQDESNTTRVNVDLECSGCGFSEESTISVAPWHVERQVDYICPECGETTRLSWEFTDE